MELTQLYLKEALHYDPCTGLFTWKTRPRHHFTTTRIWKTQNKQCAGRNAGGAPHHGYLRVRVNHALYRAHVLAWFYMTGEWPESVIDHINGVRHDNRWSNLRSVTHQENSKNSQRKRNNTSGVSGVYWSADRGKWQAQIKVNYKMLYLGRFNDFNEAVAARLEAEERHGFHPNHGRDVIYSEERARALGKPAVERFKTTEAAK